MIGGIEVIEENASDTPRLLSVGNIKVLITPLLERRIESSQSVFVTGGFESPVEVGRVFFVEIRWGQVGSSSEPPSGDFRRVFWVGDFEVAVIRVDGWCVRVAGVNDEADTGREEGEPSLSIDIRGESRMLDPHLFDGSGGKGSIDDRNVYTGLFKHSVRLLRSRGGYGKHAGDAFTALGPSPTIAVEFLGRGVDLLEPGHDPVLEVDDVFRDLITKSYWHLVESKR